MLFKYNLFNVKKFLVFQSQLDRLKNIITTWTLQNDET